MSRLRLMIVMLVPMLLHADFNLRQPALDVTALFTVDFQNFRWKCPPSLCAGVRQAMGNLLLQREGVYRSESISECSGLDEWTGVSRLKLNIYRDGGVVLLLERTDGTFNEAPGAEDGFLTDRSIFLGPAESGILLNYSFYENNLYTLLSPNGVQHRITFIRTNEDVDWRWRKKSKMLPRSRAFEVLKYADECEDRMCKKWFDKIRGVYVSNDVLLPDYSNGVERTWLKINNYNRAFVLFQRKNGLFLYKNINEHFWINRKSSSYGPYAVGEQIIRFDMDPPVLDEKSRVFAEGYLSCWLIGENFNKHVKQCLTSMEWMKIDLLKWEGECNGKITFRKVDDSELIRDSIHVINGDGGIEASESERRQYLESLDDYTIRNFVP